MKLGPGEPSAAPWRVVPVGEFVHLVLGDNNTSHARPFILAVDGRGGSGKSTIADLLQRVVPNAMVVHTDDIAWHHSFFDWSNLLIDGILKPLHRGEAVSYKPPGWLSKGRAGTIEVAAGLDLVIIEGVGASRTEAMPWIDRSVWIQSDLNEAERRGIARDGGSKEVRKFWREWQAEEFDLLQRQRPWERARVIINSTPVQPYDRSSEIVIAASLPHFLSTTTAE